ncbi:ABC transporter substrate-binding protein [Bauldia sp.]|uniref:ABC transporter substrate-binding protein n=1 Tax=Bauldia sp. TaxID=2575872 RepID=UPI003BA87F13
MPTRRQVITTSAAAVAATAISSPSVFGANADTINVAAILPLSGNFKVFGDQARAGLDLAVTEINRDGGILGQQLAIHYIDEESSPDRGVAAVRSVMDEVDPLAIVGPTSSAVRDAMMPEILARRTPLLYTTDYEGGVCNRYFFCFNTVPNQETALILPYLNARFGNRYFMLGSDYVWPQRMFGQAKAMIDELGGEVVELAYKPLGTTDFSDVIGQVQDADVDVLILAVPGDDGVAFMRQAIGANLFDSIALNFMGFERSYLDFIGRIPGEGLFVVTPFVADYNSPGVRDFVARILQNVGGAVTPTESALTSYNAMQALKLGMERSDEVSREAAIDGMAGLTFNSPTGSVAIDPINHHVTLSVFLAEASGTDFKVVEALGEMAPVPRCPS